MVRPAGTACPLSSESGPLAGAPNPGRALLLRLKGRMRLFVAHGRDFDDDEVARVKALGQIYYNQSRFYEAREWFRRALIYDPKSDEAHRTLLFMEVADRTDDIPGRPPTPPSPPSGAPPPR